MVMYANEIQTIKRKIKITWDKKIHYSIYIKWQSYGSILVMIFV